MKSAKRIILIFVVLLCSSRSFAETITLRFIDEEGKPVAGVRNSITGDDFPKATILISDQDGACVLDFNTIESTNRSFQTYIDHPDYVRFRCCFDKSSIFPTPGEYTFHMERAREIGGVILDEKGNPIEHADVEVHYLDGEPDAFKKPYWYAYMSRTATTVKEGRWSVGGVPVKSFRPLGIRVKAVGFRPGTTRIEAEDDSFEKLLKKEYPIAVLPGITVSGKLVPPKDDSPDVSLAGTMFFLSGPYHSLTEIPVSATGAFSLDDLAPGRFILRIVPENHEPVIRQLTVNEETASLDIPLRKTSPIRFRVVDLKGKPIPDASLYNVNCCDRADLGVDAKLYKLKTFFPKTKSDGLIVWENALDEAADYFFSCPGHLTRIVRLAKPRDEEYVVTLCPERTVSGTVIDAETREPPSRYWLLVLGWLETRIGGEDFKEWLPNGGRYPYLEDKDYSIDLYSYHDRCKVIVYAEGYKEIFTEEFSPKDGDRVFHFELEKLSEDTKSDHLDATEK